MSSRVPIPPLIPNPCPFPTPSSGRYTIDMAKSLHAIEYLQSPRDNPLAPVCVLFGGESFLKRQALLRLREAVLGGGEGDFSLTTFEGPKAVLRDVIEELSTRAMFGSGKRLVIVEEADEFVSRYREELEKYVAHPLNNAVLVLEVASWPSNTRLYKAVAGTGLSLDCSAPSGPSLTKWLISWAKQVHGATLAGPAAERLVEMVGPELGLLDQELAKLALSTGQGGKITDDLVAQTVGVWRAKTAWEMLDAVLDGNIRKALVELDRLLLAGENPVGVLAQVGSSLRRIAAATRLVIHGEYTGRRISPRDALQQAGVKPFALAKAERQLRRLGRDRGDQLYNRLLEADLDLKGNSTLPPRTILERLFIRLATDAAR